MERIDYVTDDNRIGLSIKYPDEVRRKWSECHTNIECENCSSENISSDKSGDLLTITCHDCENWWSGFVDSVLTWYDTEEAFIKMRTIPFRDEPDF